MNYSVVRFKKVFLWKVFFLFVIIRFGFEVLLDSFIIYEIVICYLNFFFNLSLIVFF